MSKFSTKAYCFCSVGYEVVFCCTLDYAELLHPVAAQITRDLHLKVFFSCIIAEKNKYEDLVIPTKNVREDIISSAK